MSTQEEALARHPVRVQLPVAWGEMDAFGHVNNAVYFRYFESCRMACFERIGFTRHMDTHGVGPILHSTRCRFRRALTYPDTLTVATRVTDLGDDRFTMLYRVWSHEQQALAAEGEGLIVCFDYRAGQKAPLPPVIREAIEAL